jgi:hypothetical protein
MSKKTGRILRNADLRHQSQMAGPPLEVLEKVYRNLDCGWFQMGRIISKVKNPWNYPIN